MSIETSLVTFLGDVTTAVYPMVLPEKITLPAITYYVSSSNRQYTASGASTYPVDIQLSCWGTTYAAAKSLAGDVVDLINGFSGTMGDYYVDPIFIESETDVHEPDTDRFGVVIFFSIWYRSP